MHEYVKTRTNDDRRKEVDTMIDSITQYVYESNANGAVYYSSLESACKAHENAQLELNDARQALTRAECKAISTGDELTAAKSTYAKWKKEHAHLFKLRLDLKKYAALLGSKPRPLLCFGHVQPRRQEK